MTSSGESTVNGWAELVKQCAENCNCNAETNTANQAIVLVCKLAQMMDDKGVGQEQQDGDMRADFTLSAQNELTTKVTVAEVWQAMIEKPVIGALYDETTGITYRLGTAMLVNDQSEGCAIGFGINGDGRPIVYAKIDGTVWGQNFRSNQS